MQSYAPSVRPQLLRDARSVAASPKHQTREALVFFLQSPTSLGQLDLLVQLEGSRNPASRPKWLGMPLLFKDFLALMLQSPDRIVGQPHIAYADFIALFA